MPRRQKQKNRKMPSRKAFAVAREYLARRNRDKHPDGYFDDAGRWYPAEEEMCPCIENGGVRAPSRRYPYSYMRHCRTLKHLFWLYNVQPEEKKDVRKAVSFLSDVARARARKSVDPLDVIERLSKQDIPPLDPAAVLPKWIGGPLGGKFYRVKRRHVERYDKSTDVLVSPFSPPSAPSIVLPGWQNAYCGEQDAVGWLAKGSPAYEEWTRKPDGPCGFYAFDDVREAIVHMSWRPNTVVAIIEAPPNRVAFWHPGEGWRFSAMRVAAIVNCGDARLVHNMAKVYNVPVLQPEVAQAIVSWSTQAFAPQNENPEEE